ncbi:MAG: extracellular solute-binding protein [Eubacteriales bacterium]|nr:extracellular solute-binding protein [Eubacteriales bacterium]
MKKNLALILALVLALSLLAGCGKKPPEKENVKITIKVPVLSMECVTDSEITTSDQFLQKAWDAFAAQYTDYNATADIIVFEQTDYAGAITDCYGKSEAADLLYGGYFNISGYVHDGYAVPLDDMITDAIRNDFDESMWDVSSINGKTYLMPYLNLQNILTYNKDMFRKAGLDEYISDKEEIQGWSLEDWDIILSKLADNLGENEYAFPMYAKSNQGDTHIMLQLRVKGSEFFDSNGRFNLNTPEGIAALQWIKDNYDNGYYPENCEDLEINDCAALFANKQLAFTLFNTALAQSFEGYDIDQGYVNFPAQNANGACSTFVTGFMAFDNGDTKKLEVAKAFLKYIYEHEQWLDYSAGGIPCSKGTAERHGAEVFMGDMFAENNKYVVDYQMNNPNWLGVRAAFYPHINALLSGKETPAESAAGLDADCNAAIEEGYTNSKIHS